MKKGVKKHVIITSSNAKFGEFLIDHWLRSLQNNVDLEEVDVAVIDYGLRESQRKNLLDEGVILIPGSAGGHIVNMRFADAAQFLKNTKYEQVLAVDGGDVIFQDDFTQIFKVSPAAFRAVTQESEHLYFEINIPKNFQGKFRKDLWQTLIGKSVVNAGVIFSPRNKFIQLCRFLDKMTPDKYKYGADQILVNYWLYREGFKELDKKYNFMPATVKDGYEIRDGVFYTKLGERAVIVHNVGGVGAFRAVRNFGYGEGRNINRVGMEGIRKRLFRIAKGASKFIRMRAG